MLYAGLARGSAPRSPLIERVDDGASRRVPRRLIEPVAAWYVGNVLLGTPPPENAAGGRIAFKTGTSYGYRDAWSVGFDGKRTIGVWVGRPDGAPVPGLVGRARRRRSCSMPSPAPGKLPAPLPRAPKGALFAADRQAAAAAAALPARRPAGRWREPRLHIMFPPNGARLELARDDDGKPDPVALKVAGGVAAADRAGQRRAAADRDRRGARCSSSPTGRASCGSP